VNNGQVDDVQDAIQEMIVAQYRHNRSVRMIQPRAAWIDACERVDVALRNAVDSARSDAMLELELSSIDGVSLP
jgi:hypothetical protein